MWLAFVLIYATGMAVTAFSVLRDPIFSQGYIANMGSIALWPLYWSLFLMSLFGNRKRGGPGRPSK